jgi:hypothetical protein
LHTTFISLYHKKKITATLYQDYGYSLAEAARFTHCAAACGTHPTFATIHRMVAIWQSQTGLFESRT